VARIDAHLLNRAGVTRLSYCGPVLHTRPDHPHGTREPLQLGAEIYGHAGLEADLEVLQLALAQLKAAQVDQPQVHLGDARIVASLIQGLDVPADVEQQIHTALAAKNASELQRLSAGFDVTIRKALLALVEMYGDASVLDFAQAQLPAIPAITQSLEQLRWLAGHMAPTQVSFDLADARGYAYYSGLRFAVYARQASDALVRGGRYDGVGAVFGHHVERKRPAVGFSMDLKQLVAAVPALPLRAAIRAPWGDAADLQQAIALLRQQGDTVVCVLPGHESEVDEFHCDRALVQAAGQWVVQAL
jgi:ATP phosphoribosyltransferase regulatory subunit